MAEVVSKIQESIGRAGIHMEIAARGLHSALLERRINSADLAAERHDHTEAHSAALGAIATHVAVAEANDFKSIPTKDKHASYAFGGMAGAFRRSSGVTAPQDIKLKPAPITMNHFIDPRDPTGTDIIRPTTRKERRLEKSVVKDLTHIRTLRGDQAARRRMYGNTGPNKFWSTKGRHLREKIADRIAYHEGDINAFEVQERARGRRGQMDQGEWPSLIVGAHDIEYRSKAMTAKASKSRQAAARKREKELAKATKLRGKLATATVKHTVAKDKL